MVDIPLINLKARGNPNTEDADVDCSNDGSRANHYHLRATPVGDDNPNTVDDDL